MRSEPSTWMVASTRTPVSALLPDTQSAGGTEDTLVVDTRNFEDHRSPYQTGVPSGGQKHVVERYRLNENGAHIDLEFTLEDPEYLAEPMVHRRQLNYSPHMQMFPGACDPEATRRFVSD